MLSWWHMSQDEDLLWQAVLRTLECLWSRWILHCNTCHYYTQSNNDHTKSNDDHNNKQDHNRL